MPKKTFTPEQIDCNDDAFPRAATGTASIRVRFGPGPVYHSNLSCQGRLSN